MRASAGSAAPLYGIAGENMAAKRGEWTKLGKDKVLSSGLTTAQADALGMYEVVSAAALDKAFEARPALVIPYFGTDKKPLSSHPKWPNFYRLRYLGRDLIGFKELAGEKPQRYAQPAGSGVCAYFPRNADWPVIAPDPEYEIIITEGELKAAAACGAGFPTIGLGGVWNFRSSKEGIWWLPELEQVKWVRRTVYVCFDSDYLTKPNVCSAINGLMAELQERGAFVKLLALPEGEGEQKVGLDDYLLEHTPEDLGELIQAAEPLGITKPLWQINEEVVYVENPGLVIVPEDDMHKMSPDAFKSHSRWATAYATGTKVAVNGTLSREKVSAAPEWIKWPLRRSVRRVTYAPGQPLITESKELNQWEGWGSEPVKGSVELWHKLTQFIFADAGPGILDYFYDWCAYPIQNPGVKMFVGVVIHGAAQGTGKTLIGYTLARIYGKNFKEITDEDLEETYWAENKQFILGDEITGKDNRQYMNTLKRLITKETIDVNIKFVPQFQLPNCMNFMFTSQHGDSFFLEDKDRRFLVVEVTAEPLPDKFYLEYDKWYKNGGANALHDWLLRRKISPQFNPMGHAPRTLAKERMIAATKSEAGSWVYDLQHFPDQILRMGEMKYTRDIFSSRELLMLYERDNPNSKMTVGGMGRALGAAGLQQILGGQPIFNPNTNRNERMFAVRNTDIWKKCKDRKKITAHLSSAPVRGGKK